MSLAVFEETARRAYRARSLGGRHWEDRPVTHHSRPLRRATHAGARVHAKRHWEKRPQPSLATRCSHEGIQSQP
eukprot:2054487-Pleurochrysis_carterae.AAC.2